MNKALLVVSFWVGLAAHASVPQPGEDYEYLSHSQTLVREFLDAKAREYGVDLRPDPNTWTVHHPYSQMVLDAFVLANPHHVMRADEMTNGNCREVTVELPQRAARARFYVARNDGAYRLVGSCRMLVDHAPRLLIDPIAPRRLDMPKREFAARALPLIQNYLTLNGVSGQPDWSSVRLRPGRGWLSGLWHSPVNDCRAFEVRVGEARHRLYVVVKADESEFLADVPMALQILFKDSVGLRTYRFAVVRGCDEPDQVRPPELTPPDPNA